MKNQTVEFFARLFAFALVCLNALGVFSQFDGDGRADVSVFRPSNGTWLLLRSTAGFTGRQFGANGDLIAPADFDGAGETDLAVFRGGAWYVVRSGDGSFFAVQFGVAGDLPRPGDFDGDRRADIAVFRPSNGGWYMLLSGSGFSAVQFGTNNDVPIPSAFN